jgi:hypothetical protein
MVMVMTRMMTTTKKDCGRKMLEFQANLFPIPLVFDRTRQFLKTSVKLAMDCPQE